MPLGYRMWRCLIRVGSKTRPTHSSRERPEKESRKEAGGAGGRLKGKPWREFRRPGGAGSF